MPDLGRKNVGREKRECWSGGGAGCTIPPHPPSLDPRSGAVPADCPGRSSRDAGGTPETSPIGRRGNGSRSRAVNPEVLRSGGPGDSFEWNRADSSPVRRARARPSLTLCCSCCRCRVATAKRPGCRPRTPARLQVRRGSQVREVRGDGRARPRPARCFPESRCPAEVPLEARALTEGPGLLRLPRGLPGCLAEFRERDLLPLGVSALLNPDFGNLSFL